MDLLMWRSRQVHEEYFKNKVIHDPDLFYIRCPDDKNELKAFAETAMEELFKREYEGYFKYLLCNAQTYEDRHSNDFPHNSPACYYMRRDEWCSLHEFKELHFEFVKSDEKTWSIKEGPTPDIVMICFPSKLIFKRFMQALYEASQKPEPTMIDSHLQFSPPSLMC
jgi:hypothetical protein